MLLFSGQDILRKWVIVKGKKKFKLLRDNPFNYYEWIDYYANNVILFNSQQDAQEFIDNELPNQNKFKNAYPKLLTINIS